MIRMTIDTAALTQAASRLAGTDWQKSALEEIGKTVKGFVDEAFKAEGRPGKHWKALRPHTLHKRKDGGRGSKILQDTGRLAGSVTSYLVGDDTVKVETVMPYADVHQHGRKIHHKVDEDKPRTVTIGRYGNKSLFLRMRHKSEYGKAALARNVSTGEAILRKADKGSIVTKTVQVHKKEYDVEIPARPFMPTAEDMTDRERDILARVYIRHVQRAMGLG